MIRVCKLSDEQIEKRAAVAHRSMGRNLIADEHHFLRAAVYDEVLDRRRAAKLDALAHSMAYEFATSLIDGMCLSQLDEAESPEPFLDLDSCGEPGYIDDEVEYLEARGLLIHHPRNPRWVQFHDESEAYVTQAHAKGGNTHTPGPWHYQEESDAYTHIVRGPNNEHVVQFAQGTNGRDEANARLVACAPEMADMLLSMFSHVSHGGPTRGEAEALLKKAGVIRALE